MFTLDLGNVKNIAEARLNGADLPLLWKPPYCVDIAPHAGRNTLQIQVTNLCPNRLIGDEQEPEDMAWGPTRTFTVGSQRLAVGEPLTQVPEWLTNDHAAAVERAGGVFGVSIFQEGFAAAGIGAARAGED